MTAMTKCQGLGRKLTAYAGEQHGAAAVEMAIWLIFLVPALLNAFDLSLYTYQQMQVKQAAQVAAAAAFASCSQQGYASLSSSCSGFTNIINNAAQTATSLTSSVTASTAEGNYCVSGTTGGLVTTGCTTTAHYLLVTTTFTYTPMFRNVTVTSLLPSSISSTAWVRTS
jgi:Flp pilus assembly protein TadG